MRDPASFIAPAHLMKVTFVPGDIDDAERADAATMRLSFLTPSPEQVREGVAHLGRAIARLQA
jgi:DNA-binding transcriptional MocR family regulator